MSAYLLCKTDLTCSCYNLVYNLLAHLKDYLYNRIFEWCTLVILQVYRIHVITPARNWFIFRRYSDFEKLNQRVSSSKHPILTLIKYLNGFCVKYKHIYNWHQQSTNNCKCFISWNSVPNLLLWGTYMQYALFHSV